MRFVIAHQRSLSCLTIASTIGLCMKMLFKYSQFNSKTFSWYKINFHSFNTIHDTLPGSGRRVIRLGNSWSVKCPPWKIEIKDQNDNT